MHRSLVLLMFHFSILPLKSIGYLQVLYLKSSWVINIPETLFYDWQLTSVERVLQKMVLCLLWKRVPAAGGEWSVGLASESWNCKSCSCIGLCIGNSSPCLYLCLLREDPEGGLRCSRFFIPVLFCHIGSSVKNLSPCDPVHFLIVVNCRQLLRKWRSLNLTHYTLTFINQN